MLSLNTAKKSGSIDYMALLSHLVRPRVAKRCASNRHRVGSANKVVLRLSRHAGISASPFQEAFIRFWRDGKDTVFKVLKGKPEAVERMSIALAGGVTAA